MRVIEAKRGYSFQFFLARLLGTKAEGRIGNEAVMVYLWRGNLYIS